MYHHQAYFYYFSAGIDSSSQTLTSKVDPRAVSFKWRIHVFHMIFRPGRSQTLTSKVDPRAVSFKWRIHVFRMIFRPGRRPVAYSAYFARVCVLFRGKRGTVCGKRLTFLYTSPSGCGV